MIDVETTASKVLPALIQEMSHYNGLESYSKYLALDKSYFLYAFGELIAKIKDSPTALKAAQLVANSPEREKALLEQEKALQITLEMELKMGVVDILDKNHALAEKLYSFYEIAPDVETTATKILPALLREISDHNGLESYSKYLNLDKSYFMYALSELIAKIKDSPTALKAAQLVVNSPEREKALLEQKKALQLALKMEVVDILAKNHALAEKLYSFCNMDHHAEAIASRVLPYLRPRRDPEYSTQVQPHNKWLNELMVKIEGSPTALKAAQMVTDAPAKLALELALKMELVDILDENRTLAEELAKGLDADEESWKNVSFGSIDHVDAAAPSLNRMIILVGVLGLLIVVGGICAIILNAVSETKINIAGMSISTGHVGVAFVGLGIIMVIRVYRQISSILFKLAELPDSRSRRRLKARPTKKSKSRK
jgi:hypothetical protein